MTAVLTGALALACGSPGAPPGVPSDLWDLSRKLGRRTDLRLSVDPPYRPCNLERVAEGPFGPPACTFAQLTPQAERDLAEVGRQLRQQALDDGRSPRAEGLWYLSSDASAQSTASAVKALTFATERSPENAPSWNDLAVAFYQKWIVEKDSYDLVRALDAVDHALEHDGTYRPALFNLAVLLSRLCLTGQAELAWLRVEQAEFGTPWLAEAVAARHALQRQRAAAITFADLGTFARGEQVADPRTIPDLDEDPQPYRLLLQEELLPAWGAAIGAGNLENAAAVLETGHAAAERLTKETGDTLLFDVIEHLRGQGIAAQLRLGKAFEAYAVARKHHEAQEYEAARELFRSAAHAFAGDGSPFEVWPRFYDAVIDHHHSKQDEARRALLKLLDRPARIRWPVLVAHLHWMLGLAAEFEADAGSAMQHYNEALRLFGVTNELENAGAASSLLGAVLTDRGDLVLGWRRQIAALAARGSLRKPRRLLNVLEEVADVLRESGEVRVGVWAQNELLGEAAKAKAPLPLAVAHLARSRWLRGLDRDQEARDDAERAAIYAREIPDKSIRESVSLDAEIARASTLSHRQPEEAARSLSVSARRAHALGDRFLAIDVAVAKAEASLASGDVATAAADLAQASAEAAAQLRLITDPRLRSAFHTKARRIVAARLGVSASVGDSRALHAIVDAWRAATWAEIGSGPARHAITDVLGILPAGAALVEYFVEEDTLWVWVARDQTVHLRCRPLNAARARRAVAELLGELAGKAAPMSVQSLAEELWQHLIAPISDLLEGVGQLVIVADETLRALPWSVLRAPASGRYLIEDHAIVVTPGATVFLGLPERPPARDPTALLVGCARSAGSEDLRALPGVQAELTSVAAAYRHSHVLRDSDCSSALMGDLLAAADVLHFSGHARIVDGRGELLFLSSDQRGLGARSPGATNGRSLRRLQLAVLAGCETGLAGVSSSDVERSAAESFLLAGVPTVVASLWPIDDAATVQLVAGFHAHYSKGAAAPIALRLAQLPFVAARSERIDGAATWGSLQAFGAILSGNL